MAHQANPPISRDDWKLHQSLIRELYIAQRQPLEKIRTFLAEKYSFQASLQQYKRKLRAWGVKKNHDQAFYHALDDSMERRKLCHEPAQVWSQGDRLSPRKLERARRRHRLDTFTRMQRRFVPGQTAVTPEGVLIQGLLPNPSALSTSNLPCFEFLGNLRQNIPSLGSRADRRFMSFRLVDPLSRARYLPLDRSDGDPQTSNARVGTRPALDPAASLSQLVCLCANNHLDTVTFDKNFGVVLEPERIKGIAELFKLESSYICTLKEYLLIYAARRNRSDILEILKIANMNVSRPVSNRYQRTSALEVAIRYGSFSFCQDLLKHGYAVNADLRRHPSILALAATHMPEMLLPIVERTLPPTKSVLLPVAVNAGLGTDFLAALLEPGVDVNAADSEGLTALRYACSRGDAAVVELLLRNGASPDTTPIPENEDSCLIVAARQGNLEICEMMLRGGANVNLCHKTWNPRAYACELSYRESALHKAAFYGHLATVKLLLDYGADPSISSELSPLCVAAQEGHLEVVRLLMTTYSDPDAVSAHANFPATALQVASDGGHIGVMSILIEGGADVNAPAECCRGRTALQAAVERRHKDAVKLLIHLGADINASCAHYHGVTALQAAVLNSDEEMVEYLLHQGADVNALPSRARGYTAVSAAVKADSQSLFRSMIERGANADTIEWPDRFDCNKCDYYNAGRFGAVKDFHSPLVTALRHGRISFVPPLLLLDRHLDFRLRSDMSLAEEAVMAARRDLPMDIPKLIEVLRAVFQNCTSVRQTVLNHVIWSICEAGHDVGDHCIKDFEVLKELIQILLEKGVDINTATHLSPCILTMICELEGIGALEKDPAFLQGKVNFVKFLLDNGADVNTPASDSTGQYALQAATGQGSLPIVRLLLDRGADVNASACAESGRTALQAASELGRFDLVQLLLNHGADVNGPACAILGVTALQAAAIEGYLPIAQLLLATGADVGAPGSITNGRTALNGAAERGRLDMVKLLLDHYRLKDGESISQLCDEAAEYARRQYQWGVVQLLETYQREPCSSS